MAVRYRRGILTERKDSNTPRPGLTTKTTKTIIQKRSTTLITNQTQIQITPATPAKTKRPRTTAPPAPVTHHKNHHLQGKKMAGEIRFSQLGNSTQNKTTTANNNTNTNAGNNTRNASRSRTPRKLWTLQDRSAVSVNLLKANLAEDGCEEAQLDVAKKLLTDAQMSPDAMRSESYDDTTRKAVYWLIKSSEQGNEEATQLLEDCLKSGRGITGQNVLDVRTCIDTCRNEKFTFKAARILHAKLSNGEEFITTTQLRARLQSRRDRSSPTKSPQTPVSRPEDSSSDNESENNFSSPNGLNTTFTVDPEDNNFNFNIRGSESLKENESGSESKYLNSEINSNYSIPGVKMTLEDLLRTASTHNAGEIPPTAIDPADIVPQNERWNLISLFSAFIVQLILGAYLTDTCSISNSCLLASIYLLAWTSYNLRLWRKRQNNFQGWTDSFKSVLRDGVWNQSISETRLVSNWLTTYLIGSGVSLLLFTCLPDSFTKVTFGTIMLLSLCRAHRDFKFRPNSRILLLVILPLLRNFGGFIRTIDFESIRLSLGPVLENFGLPDYLSTLTDVLQDQVYVYLPESPEYLTASLLLKVFQGIVLLSLAWSAKSVLLDILILFWFHMTITWCMGLSAEELVMSGILVVCAESIYYLVTRRRNEKSLSLTSLLTLLTMTVISVISLGLSVQYFCTTNNYGENVQYLTWDEYDSNCHTQAWQSKSQNIARTQMYCSLKYENSPVKWTGVISVVKLREMDKIANTKNRGAVFEISVNILDSNSGQNEGVGAAATATGNSWNWLGFDENANKNDISAPPILVLLSTKELENGERTRATKYVLNFRTGDKIEFDGILIKDVGGLQPEIGVVKSVKCLSCAVADYGVVRFGKSKAKSLEFVQNLDESYQTILILTQKVNRLVWDFVLS